MSRLTIIRWLVIDKCLKDPNHEPKNRDENKRLKGYWTLEELADAVGEEFTRQGIEADTPAQVTIKKDIKAINSEEKYDVHIINKYGVGYTYEDKSKSLALNPLTDFDINKLKEVITILNQYKGFKQFEDIGGLIHNLQNKVLEDEIETVILDTRPNLKGLDYIDTIIKAIKNKKVLNIIYEPYDKDSQSLVISPYQLKEYNNRWFILCKNNQLEFDFSIYPIDRISALKLSKCAFIPQELKKIKSYFDHVYGVTVKGNSIEDIVIKVKKPRAYYIKTKPEHSSQKILSENDAYIRFDYQLIINNELISYFLSFGKDLEVEAPESLRSMMHKRIMDMSALYD